MADHKRHPWYRTIIQSMESIIQYVDYKEVRFKLITHKLIEPEDLEEYDNLKSEDAVAKITIKVLRSIPDCEEFVKVLKEMPQSRYKLLTETIDTNYEENTTTQDSSTTPHRNLVVTIQRPPECSCKEDAQSTVDGSLKESQKIAEVILTQEDSSTTPHRNLVVTIQRPPECSCEEDAQSTVDGSLKESQKIAEVILTQEDSSTTPHRNLVVTIQRPPECSCEEDAQSTVDGSLEESQKIAEAILTQDIVTAKMNHVIGLKKIAGETFAQFLMKSTKMFRKAIEDNKICLEKSAGQSIIHKLHKYRMLLKNAHHTICSTEEGTRMFKNAVATVILHAQKILLVIKNILTIKTIKWLKLSESAENIGMLMSMFQKITEMVSTIQVDNNEPLYQLFGNITDLNATLTKIKKTLHKTTKIMGVSGSLLYAIGGVTCIILGTILCVTPVAPVGIPFIVAGGFIVVTSPVAYDYFKSFYSDITNAIDYTVKEGQKDGEEFVKGDFELSTS